MSDGLKNRWRVGLPVVVLGLVAVAILANVLRPNLPASSDGKRHVVCTFLPMYVFTQNVVGDVPGVEVHLLISRDAGCPHSYALTGQDLKKISRADVIVANGLGIEPFLDQILRKQSRVKLITIADDCDLIRSGSEPADEDDGHVAETKPAGSADSAGNEHKCDHGHKHNHSSSCSHGHDHGAAHGHDHSDSDVNAHTWVSPRQAIIQVRTLAKKLGEVDAANAEQYRVNGEAYVVRLEALAQKMESAARDFTNRNIVTGHAAFDYLARDLGLNVVATLTTIPGETGSAAEMARVIDAIRKSRAAAVFQEPPFSDKMAETIARDAGVPVYPLNPLNSDAGLPKAAAPQEVRRLYEDVMEQNLATLQRALK